MRLRVALALSALLALGLTARADPKLIEFKNVDGRYAVVAPGKASKPDTKKLAVGATGLAIPVTTVRWDGPNSTTLAVTYADYPETFREVAPKTILDGVLTGLKGTDGKETLNEKVTLGTDPNKVEGREFIVVAGTKTAVRVRVFLVDTRLYQVMVTGTKDNVGSKAATAFLDSFQIVK
jgi:hypothetical protein